MKTDEQIIKACLKGERAAQRVLYTQYKNRLFSIALRYSDSHDEAQDILQDGFVKIYRDLKDYRPIASLYTWMRTIVVRTALECIRRKKSRIGRGVPIEEAYSSGVGEKVSAQLGAEELMDLVRNLSEELRTVFNLYAIDGYSHKEIAELTGITVGNSKVRLSRARAILKKEVEILFEVH